MISHTVKSLYLFFLLINSLNSVPHKSADSNNYLTLSDSSVTININAVGDLMSHSSQFNYARVKKDSFNFKPVFRYVRKYLIHSDLTIGNIETVFAGSGEKYSGYPKFNTPDAFIKALQYTGFDVLFTANNHALDQGKRGLLRSYKEIEKYGIVPIGSYIDSTIKNSIKIINVKGIKIAFLAYSYASNVNYLNNNQWGINRINKKKIKKDILKAKKLKPDVIIVYFHFGKEYDTNVTAYQKQIVNFTFNQGADIILGSHTHVIQPFEFVKKKSGLLDTGFVAYSLGNFISNQRWRFSDSGVILNFQITKNFSDDSVFISTVKFIPTWVFKGKTKKGKEFVILPSELALTDSLPVFITPAEKLKMIRSYIDTKKILTKYTKKIKIDRLFVTHN